MAARSISRISAEPTSLNAPSRITVAAATPPSWVSVRSRRATPRRVAASAATPRRRSAGGPSPRTTSTSCQPIPAGAPRAFDAASFAANRAA